MSYTIQQHLTYSVWATERLKETLEAVDEAILFAETKSSFPSIAKTLLHAWDAEVIWLKRLQGISLDSWPSQNFKGGKKELLEGIVQSAKNLAEFVESKGVGYLSTSVTYKNLKGDSFENQVEDMLFHVVNHGTYHRGQVTTLLHQLGVTKIQSMDIIFYLRELNKS
ncbi:MAG: DinB family protein [Cyclobacteriaceae bacterium]|jgi:uncharacterized damage-inducible protein DinB|nr:DinB family protein [Flammeovirgaceae bacterium]